MVRGLGVSQENTDVGRLGEICIVIGARECK